MLLFEAPLDFDREVFKEFENLIPTASFGSEVTVWVCDPKRDSVIDRDALSIFPNLEILATPSTGTNHIDLDACKRRGVKVLSLLDDRVGLETISASAEFTFKLLLDALRIPPAHELQGKEIGMVGHGRIGRRVDLWCQAFGAHVNYIDDWNDGGILGGPRRWDLKEIFRGKDAVIVCCALTDETRGMITKEHLLSMKQGAVLVNTARAEIINKLDLYRMFARRPDIRFATDVVHGEVEGLAEENRAVIRSEQNTIVTPHIAGETFESRTKAARIILNLLKKELEHEQLRERGDVAATTLHALPAA